MHMLAKNIQSDDGIANSAIAEAAQRLDEQNMHIVTMEKEARRQLHRAEVLAATLRELRDAVTHNAESKEDFISKVCAILSADPDARVMPNATVSRPPLNAAKRSEDL